MKNKYDIYEKNKMLNKSYIIFLGFIICYIIIFISLITLTINRYKQISSLIEAAKQPTFNVKYKIGNIYDYTGKLISTNYTKYEIHMDLKIIPNKVLYKHFNQLVKIILKYTTNPSRNINNVASNLYYNYIKQNRYYCIIKNLEYKTCKLLCDEPLFKQNKIFKRSLIRKKKITKINLIPSFGARLIGDLRNINPSGLYGNFERILHKKSDKISYYGFKNIFYQIDKNNYMNQGSPDIYITIDADLQEKSHEFLLNQLIKSQADKGTVIVMEIHTGAIKALVNLEKIKNNVYANITNFCINEESEPGSTYKTITLLPPIEDGLININDIIDTGEGKKYIDHNIVRDATTTGFHKITIKKAFELSSNIAIASIINKHYKHNPEKFINHLKKLNIFKITNIEIEGEKYPDIPNTKTPPWHRSNLIWMAYGYGIQITPLQILNFYNCIANNGYPTIPHILDKIVYKNITSKRKILVENKEIISKKAVKIMKLLLEGVVKNGTAKNIYHPQYPYAGKTGTTQTLYWMHNKKKSYNGSFVGYYPANNPKYSCIVVIYNPKKGGYYGHETAAPVFDKIMTYIHKKLTKKQQTDNESIKNYHNKNIKTNTDKSLNFIETNSKNNILSHVIGLSGKDVIPILESKNINVEYRGVGIVKSIDKKKNRIILYLE